MTVTIELDLEASPPVVTVVDGDAELYRGLLPPMGATLPSTGEAMPGLDYDVEWHFTHPHLGELVWMQHVRDGIEVATPAQSAARRAELTVPYAWALAVLYGGESWAEFLDGETAMPTFDTLSCLTGVIYGPGAARRNSLPPAALQALIAWATPSAGGDPD